MAIPRSLSKYHSGQAPFLSTRTLKTAIADVVKVIAKQAGDAMRSRE